MATDPIGDDNQTPLERLPTGIPGLDAILRGGFLKAGIYIAHGNPGAGKTILGRTEHDEPEGVRCLDDNPRRSTSATPANPSTARLNRYHNPVQTGTGTGFSS
jgi:hypothetical protein